MTPPDFISLARQYPEATIVIIVVVLVSAGGCILESWWRWYSARRTDAREYRRRVRYAARWLMSETKGEHNGRK